jgi:hypothetical protein
MSAIYLGLAGVVLANIAWAASVGALLSILVLAGLFVWLALDRW